MTITRRGVSDAKGLRLTMIIRGGGTTKGLRLTMIIRGGGTTKGLWLTMIIRGGGSAKGLLLTILRRGGGGAKALRSMRRRSRGSANVLICLGVLMHLVLQLSASQIQEATSSIASYLDVWLECM